MKHKNTNTHLGLQRAIPNPIADVHGSWQNEVFDREPRVSEEGRLGHVRGSKIGDPNYRVPIE